MKKIPVEKSCQKCEYFKTGNFHSTDSWDRMEDWMCKKSDNRIIAGSVEWHEEKYIEIPDWCPISKSALRDKKIDKILE